GLLKLGSGPCRDIFKPLTFHIAENPIRQRGIMPQVTVQLREIRKREENVFPTIVIEIVHAEPQAVELASTQQQSVAFSSDFRTFGSTQVTEQKKRVIQDSEDYKIRLSIVIEIPKVHTHSRDRKAIVAKRHAGFQSDLLKGSAALIAKQ